MKKKSKKLNHRKYRFDWKLWVFTLIVIGILFILFGNVNVKEEKIILNIPSESVIMPVSTFVYKDISIIEANNLIKDNKDNSNFLIIDVSSNYNLGHIANAVNYPIDYFEIAFISLDKDKIYLIYSRNDIDSLNAAKKLVNNGFDKVYRLKGNYGAWVEAGFDVGR